jgi:hypothetical protein
VARVFPTQGLQPGLTLSSRGTSLPYIPNRYEAFILSNRKILADQMEFLLQGVPKSSRLHVAQ